MADDLWCVYDLRHQDESIAQMQEVSVSDSELGLDPDPLIASDAWWAGIESGAMPRHVVEGKITRVYWGSMADWAEFEVTDSAGTATTWTREGDARRYVEGLRARIEFVEHPWKTDQHGLGSHSQMKLGIWVERSPRRSSGIAPGPGGAGFQMARRHGEAAHYLLFPDRASAERAVVALEDAGRTVRVWPGGTRDQWFAQVWAPSADAARAEIETLRQRADGFGGTYDGGEVVEGEVWGPTGP